MAQPKRTEAQVIADALRFNFTSPNVADDNFEPANVVDALAIIANAIYRLAEVIEKFNPTKEKENDKIDTSGSSDNS